MSARKPKKTAKPKPTRNDEVLDRVLTEAEGALKFGMMLFIKAHDPNVRNSAEVKLQALVNLENAASKIGVARLLRATADT